MFSRIFAIAALSAVLVAATPVARNEGSCNSGPVQCCQSTQNASGSPIAGLLGLLGVAVPVNGMIGVTCNPILGGSSCSSQTVCCTGNNFNGLISLGCTPINIGV